MSLAQWLMQAFVTPLALNNSVRLEFLNLGGIMSLTRLLELHPNSRNVAAAALNVANTLMDDPLIKIEVKKKVVAATLADQLNQSCLTTPDSFSRVN